MSDCNWSLIGREMNGWHASGLSSGNKCSSSGGNLESYLSEAKEGTSVYDASEANFEEFAKFVCNGPMCDVELPDGTIRRFGDIETLCKMVPGMSGAFVPIAAQAIAEHEQSGKKFSSLDFLSVDLYLALLRERVLGVKIGKVSIINGLRKVVWE